jgi:tetratricopeptide (TPR) repeat protein
VVYEAEDTRLSRSVALKMIRGFVFSSPADRVRFRAEAGAAAHLDHPNIVPIYEIGEHLGQPFFTMKLIEGCSLAERLKNGPLPPLEAASLMAKVARAVHHAHLRGVLHRDLKPGNILLDGSGEPFLTDFGLAKLADTDSGLTVSNALLGTPQYMSPEQAAGRTNDISTASDIWALGVILYQMLSGRLPFTGDNPAEIVRRVVLTEAESLTIYDSRTPVAGIPESAGNHLVQRPVSTLRSQHRDLVTIVSRCLEKDPARRMVTAGFLADELERFFRGEPVLSRPVGRIERWWKWSRRHKAAVAAALVTGTALVAGSTISISQAVRATGALRLAEANAARAEASAKEASRQLVDADAATKVMLDTVSSLASSKSGRPLDRTEIVSELVKRARAFAGSPMSKSKLLSIVCNVAPFEERLSMRREALTLAEPLLDPEDPHLWSLRYDLARQMTSQADVRSQGIDELRKVAAWMHRHFGPEHWQTQRVNVSLAKSLNTAGEHEEAVELLAEADRLARLKSGSSAAGNRITVAVDYAGALFNAGRREEALELGREAIQLALAEFGPTSIEAARAHMPHARHCQKAELLNEAAMSARHALDICWKTVGPLGSDTRGALNMLLDLRRQRQDTEGLLALHLEAVREFDTQIGPSHKGTMARVAACLRAHLDAERLREADELGTRWLKRIRLSDGTLPPDAEGILRAHIDVLRKLPDAARTEIALREAIEMIDKLRPLDLQRYGYTSDLAEVLIKVGRTDEAEPLLHKVITALQEAADQNDKVVKLHLPQARKRLQKAVEEKEKKAKTARPA